MANNVAEASNESNAVALEKELAQHKKEINAGMEKVAEGIFETANAVYKAEELLKKNYAASGDKVLSDQRDKFFADTHLANSPSDKSKLLQIANKFPFLKEWKHHIPQNFTAFYMIATSQTIEDRIEDLTTTTDEKRKLTPNLSIRQLKNLLENREIDENPTKDDPRPKLFDIKFTDNSVYKSLKVKKLMHQHREEINNVISTALTSYLEKIGSRISSSDMEVEWSKSIIDYKEPKKAS